MKPFLFPVETYEDESLSSYLWRIAMHNGLQPNWLLHEVGIAPQKSDRLDFLTGSDLEALSQLMPLSKEDLERMSVHAFALLMVGREQFNRIDQQRLLLGSGLRFCPLCISEGEYTRRQWRLVTVTACVRHHVLLRDRCSHGTHRLRPGNWDITCFDCGECVQDTVAPDVERIAAQQHIHAVLGVGGNRENAGLPPSLTGRQYLAALSETARLTLAVEDRRAARVGRPTLDVMHNRLEAAHAVLAGWPDAFHDLLNAYRSGGNAPSDNFRNVPGRLRNLAALGVPQLRDAYLFYIGTRFGGRVDRRTKGLDPSALPPKPLLTKTEVGDALGLKWNNLEAAWKSGRFPLTQLNDGTPAMRREDVNALIAERKAWMTRELVAEQLGVDRSIVDRLVAQRLLARDKRWDMPGRWFKSAEVEQLLDRVVAACDRTPGRDWLTGEQFAQSLSTFGVNFAQILGWVLNGSVPAGLCGPPTLALRRLRFHPIQVRRLSQQLRLDQARRNGLRIWGAARLLRVKDVRIRRFIVDGLLTQDEHGRIPLDDVLRLRESRAAVDPRRRISTGEAAEILGAAPVTVRRWVKVSDLRPCGGPTVDGRREHIFRYGDVVAFKAVLERRRADRGIRASKQLWTRAEAARHLGVQPEVIDRLCAEKILARSGNGFRPGDVRKLSSNVLRTDVVTIRRAAEMLQLDRSSVLKGYVHPGRLPVVHREGSTLFVSLADVHALQQERAETLTGPEVAKLLGVRRDRVQKWRAAGRLVAVSGPDTNGNGWYRYRRADVIELAFRQGFTALLAAQNVDPEARSA